MSQYLPGPDNLEYYLYIKSIYLNYTKFIFYHNTNETQPSTTIKFENSFIKITEP